MCGLTGLLSSRPCYDIKEQAAKMTARLIHRGPDDERIWSEESIALGQTRLAILDLSTTGAQSMHLDFKRYVLVHNGEVYNHLDLRKPLRPEGAAPQWGGHSDTETLLAAMAYWGLSETLRRAHGMLAFALLDRAETHLSLARDRMGIWIEPDVLVAENVDVPPLELDDSLREFSADDPAMQMMVQDMRSYFPDDTQCKVDRAAMGISLEQCTPFLDSDVPAFATYLPVTMKIRDGQDKRVLRRVLYNHVSRELIERRKAGFAIRNGLWWRGSLRDWAENLLTYKGLTKDGLFNLEITRQTRDVLSSRFKDCSTRLWTILMLRAEANA